MINKLTAVGLIFSVLILCFISVSAYDERVFMLTDPATDLTYEVHYINKNVTVQLDSNTLGETYIQDINAATIYENILYTFYADNLNHSLFIYCFDFHGDSIYSFAVNEDAFYNERCFASDGDRFYFISGRDTKKLCIYENGNTRKVDFSSQIKELLLFDKDSLIVITAEGTFYYRGSEIITVSSTLSPPLNYQGNDIIKDSMGKEYIIDNYELKKVGSETTAVTESKDTEDYSYDFKNGFYIAEKGTTVSKIKKALASLDITRFTKANGTDIYKGKLGTGDTFTLSSGNVITIIIYGDITGEGNINSKDLKAELNHLSQKVLLKGAYLLAADTDSDGKITTKDLLILSQMY